MLHGFVVRMGVRPDVAVLFERPFQAFPRRMADQTGRSDAVDGHVGVIVKPLPIDGLIGRVFARASRKLRENPLIGAAAVNQQDAAMTHDIILHDFRLRESMPPLGGVPVAGHQLTGALVVLLHHRKIAHGGVPESPCNHIVCLLAVDNLLHPTTASTTASVARRAHRRANESSTPADSTTAGCVTVCEAPRRCRTRIATRIVALRPPCVRTDQS